MISNFAPGDLMVLDVDRFETARSLLHTTNDVLLFVALNRGKATFLINDRIIYIDAFTGYFYKKIGSCQT